MEIPKLSILTKEQVFGPDKLKIFNVIDPRAAVTDTAILRGAELGSYWENIDTNDASLFGRTSSYWLRNTMLYCDYYVRVINKTGLLISEYRNLRKIGIRLAFHSSSVQSILSRLFTDKYGLQRIEYGFYPGSAVDVSMQRTLENAYNIGSLTNLGKGCTFDGRKYDDYDKTFLPENQIYYEYKGRIYARIKANTCSDHEFTLSNKENYFNGNYVWVNVEPITWIRHHLDDIFISEKVITSGIRFDGIPYKKFNVREIEYFLDNYLAQDIFSSYNCQTLNEEEKFKKINNFLYVDDIKKAKSKILIKKHEENNNKTMSKTKSDIYEFLV